MFTIRRAAERGHFDHGWLDTWHTFSFADYHDPAHVRFRALRVINEDRVAPGTGFDFHPHRDMEIVTYVLAGELEHRDSLGNHGSLRAGELQQMTAGAGIVHSEKNPSTRAPVHLYQIWLLPHTKGLTPSYEQKSVATSGPGFRAVVTPDGRDGTLRIHQDATLYLARLGDGETARHELERGRHAWLQVLRGAVVVNGHTLAAGDGAALSNESGVMVQGRGAAEVMLFDLA